MNLAFLKKTSAFLLLVIIGLGFVFSQDKKEENIKFPLLKGNYFGQKPPGIIPKIFAPNIISTRNYERSLVFSRDYNELFYQMRGRQFNTFIFHMKKENDTWSTPEMAFFSGINGYNDDYPSFSPDGNKLFFNSNRPIELEGLVQTKADIWYLQKKGESWSEPIHISSPVNSDTYESTPSISLNGNLYFESNRDSENNDWGIFMSKFENEVYQKPEKLPAPIDSDKYEGHVFIAPDESYILFDSNREGGYGDLDIYVSFNINGNWSEAFNLGDKINTYSHEVAPTVSPDEKYLFYTTFKLNPTRSEFDIKKFTYDEMVNILNGPGNGSGDIYWVSTEIIESLRPKA